MSYTFCTKNNIYEQLEELKSFHVNLDILDKFNVNQKAKAQYLNFKKLTAHSFLFK